MMWVMISLIICILISGLFWANHRFVERTPGGENILVYWQGTRIFLLEGLDPYSTESNSRNQELIIQNTQYLGKEEIRFIPPLYVIIFYLPFLFIRDFTLVRTLWMTILEIVLVMQVILSLRVINWKPDKLSFGLLLLFSIFGFHSFESLVKGDHILIAALCLTGGLLSIRIKRDELAGVLFALTTISIHSVFLFLVFIFYWIYKKKRWKILLWFLITLFLLLLSVTLLVPEWIFSFLRAVYRFFQDYPIRILEDVFVIFLPGMGRRIGWIISGISLGLIIFEWWLSQRVEWRGFLWTVSFTLVINMWLGIRVDPRTLVFIMPTFILLFSLWVERWQRAGRWFVWVVIIFFLFGEWFLYLSPLGNHQMHRALTLVVVPTFLLGALYWVKWWAIQPPKTWLDAYYAQENKPER